MSNEVTLTQLAAEMAHLRQQIEIVNQRLDMIYGAITRLADAKQSDPSPTVNDMATPKAGPLREQPSSPSASTPGMPLSASMMMDPGSILESLHQYALKLGMDVPTETVDRLKSDLPTGATPDESK
jgi:hypothetical protein